MAARVILPRCAWIVLYLSLTCQIAFVQAKLSDLFRDKDTAAFRKSSTHPGAESPNPLASSNDLTYIASPQYPSPWSYGSGDWKDAHAKARTFVDQLTLLEKVNLTTGTGWQNGRCVGETGSVPRLGFRPLCLQDSPVGIRFTDRNSVFPAGISLAATFDKRLAREQATAMAIEFRGKGIDVLLGPVAGPMGRAPTGGRNWEGFGPDPVLNGIMTAESVQGIQSTGIIACVKHFIANEQEHLRLPMETLMTAKLMFDSASNNLDDVTMHELYLWPFAEAVRAGVGSVMCAYTQVNNSHSCQNSYLLNHLLKNELDFQGFVVSDWGAQNSGVSSALAGLDMSMPGDTVLYSGQSYWGSELTLAVANGSVPMWRLDDMVIRIMAPYYYVKRDENATIVNFSSWTSESEGFEIHAAKQRKARVNQHVDVTTGHANLIRKVGGASTILLKNEKNTLPLQNDGKSIAIIGLDATANPGGPNACVDRGCNWGTLATGWGSGSANFPYLITPVDAIESEVRKHSPDTKIAKPTQNSINSAIVAARHSETSLVFVNADSGEAYLSDDGNQGDRNDLELWKDGGKLVDAVAALCKNTILIIHSVGPVLIQKYKDHENISAILWAGLPGQESGNAITDVLYGRVNPGAKLPFSIAQKREHYSSDVIYNPNNHHAAPQINFTEGIFIDYRSLDHRNITPTYEFGFGLSYTQFRFSNLKIYPQVQLPDLPGNQKPHSQPPPSSNFESSPDMNFPKGFQKVKSYIYPYLDALQQPISNKPANQQADLAKTTRLPTSPSGGFPGGNQKLFEELFHIEATIENIGTVTGDEVAQLYISLGGPYDAKSLLRDFDRLTIDPGKSVQFRATLRRKDVSNWDPVKQDWVISTFEKMIYVGSSSRALPLSAKLPVIN